MRPGVGGKGVVKKAWRPRKGGKGIKGGNKKTWPPRKGGKGGTFNRRIKGKKPTKRRPTPSVAQPASRPLPRARGGK